jgi:serine/threonine-protein kinase
MSYPASDYNLLFGILAFQMDLVSRDDLIAAMNAWVLDKAKPLSQVLLERGVLDADSRAWLEAGVQRHLARFGQDPQLSLAALKPPGSVQEELRHIADPDVQASLAHVGATPTGNHLESTGPYVGPGTLPPHARFRILRPHAKGGLGEVFVARDQELNREVALKEILAAQAAQPESRARFLLEAEVTGALEHPGVVPVYGLGAYADGRPFYAMRFVQGDSLKDAIRAFHEADRRGRTAAERSLALRQLLRRFVDVCNAMAYAHSRGVLHRDLKPANVMLGKYGETLVVDWGLAKVMGHAGPESAEGPLRPSLGGDPAMTQTGAALGTPAYMSPEQAAGKLDQLGPASDVYSLGATLYCLLTGRAPFAEGEVADVLARVQRGDFPPPRQENRQVPPALEAVCLKAMALRPGDRYATPRDLADEVEHWLADEPVAAYREPAATRLSRWGRRHRSLVAGAAALLLTAVAALGVGLVLLEQAAARTENQRKLAEANFADAQRQRDLARSAVDEYFVKVSEDTVLKYPGLQPLRKELLETALKYYQGFVEEHGDDPELKAELARTYFRVGFINGEIGKKEDALNAFRAARDLYQELSQVDPQNASFRGDLAWTYRRIGLIEQWTDRRTEAGASFQQAITLGKELAKSHPDAAAFQRDLAWSYIDLGVVQQYGGQFSAARHSFQEAIATWKHLINNHPRAEFRIGLSQAYTSLGWLLCCAGSSMSDAVENCRQAVVLCDEVLRENGADLGFRNRLGNSLENLGYSYYLAGQEAKAREALQRALDIAEPLARDNPAVPEFRERVAQYNVDLGHVLLYSGRDAEARRCLEAAQALVENRQDTNSGWFLPGTLHAGLGKLHRRQGQADAALNEFRKAVRIGETSPIAEKPLATYQLACARAQCSALIGQGKTPLSGEEQAAKRRYADQAMEALRQAVAEGWENVGWMKLDTDLDALRARTDFQKLLEGLQEKANAEAKAP